MIKPPTDQLLAAVTSAMETATKRIVEEEAKSAAARVEERVRGMAGEIATKVASWVNYERCGNELRITVRLPDRDKSP